MLLVYPLFLVPHTLPFLGGGIALVFRKRECLPDPNLVSLIHSTGLHLLNVQEVPSPGLDVMGDTKNKSCFLPSRSLQSKRGTRHTWL